MKNSVVYYKSLYYAILMVLFFALGYMFCFSGMENKIRTKIYYQSTSDVQYKINYKNTESDLLTQVDNIDMNYIYRSVFGDNTNGYYQYDVIAYLNAYENNIEDTVWFKKFNIVENKTISIDDNDNVEIRDKFNLDIKKYQNEINKFMLEEEKDVSGYLNVQIRVSEYVLMNQKLNNTEKNRIININIPITNVDNEIKIDNVSIRDSYYDFNKHSIMNYVLIVLSMLCFTISILLLLLVIKQCKIMNDRQNKYFKFVRKILSKYDYCIVKVNKVYVKKKYNLIYVASFNELLDVYKVRNKMINYKEVKRGVESIFVIIDSNDAWIYRLTSDNLGEGR